MTRKNDFTDKVDYEVGRRVLELRKSMGWSREQLARKIDVTHQQLQKYEKATNRISAGRLAAVAKALKKPIEYFFEATVDGHSENERMAIEVSRNFLKISKTQDREAVNNLVRVLGRVK